MEVLPKVFYEPIEILPPNFPTILTTGSDEEYQLRLNTVIENYNTSVKTEVLKKLLALAKYFDLDTRSEDFWMNFCFLIAQNLLTGFQVVPKKQRHRKKVWNDVVLYILWYEVESTASKKKDSKLNACRILVTKEPWNKLIKRRSHKALYQQYQKSRRSEFVALVERINNNEKTKDLNSAKNFYSALKSASNVLGYL